MIYLTADTHFSHALCSKERGFSSIEEHDETLIDNWNKTVSNKDIVYHLGDFALLPRDKAQILKDRLNGKIHLIKGNHDKHPPEGFIWVKDVFQLKHYNQKVWLSHYCHQSWPSSFHGSYHVFGHSHGAIKPSPDKLRMDVGLDSFNLKPVSIDEVFGIFNYYKMIQMIGKAVS
mgnify:CR=1 FL=1